MNNRKLAEFLFGMVDMSVANELPEEEQLQMLQKDLDNIAETNLYYYLTSIFQHQKKGR